jgi:hypothetical protein
VGGRAAHGTAGTRTHALDDVSDGAAAADGMGGAGVVASEADVPTLRLVAVVPPPDADERVGGTADAVAIRGVAIVDGDGDGDVAGGGLMFADASGALTKIRPVGKRDLFSLE